jgi:hypothetical protein
MIDLKGKDQVICSTVLIGAILMKPFRLLRVLAKLLLLYESES